MLKVYKQLKHIEDWMSFIAALNLALIGVFMYQLGFTKWRAMLFFIASTVILIATIIRRVIRKHPKKLNNEHLIMHINHLEHSIFIWSIWIIFLLAFIIGETEKVAYWRMKSLILITIGIITTLVGVSMNLFRRKQHKKQTTKTPSSSTRLFNLRTHANITSFFLFTILGSVFLKTALHIAWIIFTLLIALLFLILIIITIIKNRKAIK